MKESRFVFGIFVFALIIRLSFGIYMFHKNGTSGFVDDYAYIYLAENMLEQGVFVKDISDLSRNADVIGPGFPLIVALSIKIFGNNYYPIIILNAFISSLIVLVIYKLGILVFNRRVALLSSIWSSIYILQIRYIPRVIKEVWLAFLLPLLILYFIKSTKWEKIDIKFYIFPLLYSFFIHMDERFFVYLPVIIIGIILFDENNVKTGLKKSSVFFLITIITMIPWTIRNYQVYNRPVILTIRTAPFTDPILGYEDKILDKKEKRQTVINLYKAKRDSILMGYELSKNNPERVKQMQKAIELGYYPHEFNKVERYWAELKEFWRPIRIKGNFVGTGFRFEGPSWSLKHNLTKGLTYGILLPFFIIGIVYSFRNNSRYGKLFILIIVIHMFVHVVVAHVRNRYRIPVDSFIILLAFYGIDNLLCQFKILKNE